MTEIDATALYQLHQKWQNNADLAGQPIPTTTDMLVKLTAQALSEHPEMNASLEGNVILRRKSISIGLTLDNDAGVIIPVVKDANYKSLRQIANESAVFAEKENAGSLSQDDCGGSTFSVIDLGMTDVDFFTPVINLPECAILGIGRIKTVPAVDPEEGTISIRKAMVLSLTFDHRIVDGAPAGRFLKRIKQLVEEPDFWLL